MGHKIPFVTASNAGIEQRLSVEKAGQPGRDLARFGEMGLALDEQWRNARIESQINQVKAEMYRDQASQGASLEGRQDFANFVPDTENLHEENRNKYQEMATEKRAWERLQPIVEHGFASQIITARHKARLEENNFNRTNYYKDQSTYSQLMAVSSGDERKKYAKEFEDYTDRMVSTGVIDAAIGIHTKNRMFEQSDMTRLTLAIRKNADAVSLDNLDSLIKEYPYLQPTDILKAQEVAYSEGRRKRLEEKEAKQEMYESSAGSILKAYGQAVEKKKIFGMKDLNAMAFDEDGNMVISNSTYDHFIKTIQADAHRRETEGRKEPEVTAETWRKLDEFYKKEKATVDDVIKLMPYMPISMVGGAFSSLAQREKEVSNLYYQETNKYIESVKSIFSNEDMGRMRHEFNEIRQDKKIDPEKWQDTMRDRIIKNYLPGAMGRKMQERMAPLSKQTTTFTPLEAGTKPASIMTEADARKALEAKGYPIEAIDTYIAQYKKDGKIR